LFQRNCQAANIGHQSGKKFEVQAQTQTQRSLQDTDIPTAAIQLSHDNTALTAAMSAQAKRPNTSLFDFLPPR
jgi:hypothetical protein